MNLAVAQKTASFSSEDYLQTWEIMHISCTVTMISRIKKPDLHSQIKSMGVDFSRSPICSGRPLPTPASSPAIGTPGRCPALRGRYLHFRRARGKSNHFFFKFCCSTVDLHCCVNICYAAKWFIYIHILYISIYTQMCKYIFFCFDLS